MLKVNGITDDAKQKHTLLLPDGTTIVLLLDYKPLQIGWFITSIAYADFELLNLRLTTSPNMLRQFKNKLPFGLACFVNEGQEPTLKKDFLSGRAKLYVLTSEEVQLYEDILSGQATA